MCSYRFGTGKWVFVDWIGVNAGYGTAWGGAASDGMCMPEGIGLKVHSPRIELAPVLEGERGNPWESRGIAFANFVEDGGRFRCWYTSMAPNDHPKYRLTNRMGYAESDDGIVWHKPTLNLNEFAGSTANNLTHVAGNYPSQYGLVFIDPSAPSEARYKMAAPGGRHGLCGAYSSDGLQFTSYDEPILPGNNTDTDDTGWYNPRTGKYAVYLRQRDNITGRRGINRSESADFAHFPPSTPVIEANPLDPPDWDYYTNAFTPWPGATDAYIMRIAIFKRSQDCTEIHLATSRDEFLWHRPQGLTPWLTMDRDPSERRQCVYMCGGVLQTAQGEWSQYFSAWRLGHNEVDANLDVLCPSVLRATMREDGFVSLSAEGHGQFWTVPFSLDSDQIRLNVRTRLTGYVRCELLDVTDVGQTGGSVMKTEPLPGYGLDDFDPISGDHIDAPLRWGGRADLRALKGRKLVLRFKMFKADLYSIRFQSNA